MRVASVLTLLWWSGCHGSSVPETADDCNQLASHAEQPNTGEPASESSPPTAALSADAGPPGAALRGPALLSAKAGHALLAINPQIRPYKVVVPEQCVAGQQEFQAIVRICVDEQGSVSSVKLLRPSVPFVDRQIPQVIPRWRFRPYLVDGQTSAFCYNMAYHIRGKRKKKERTGWLF
jgi:TonB family protein